MPPKVFGQAHEHFVEAWANGPDTFLPGYIIPGGVAKPVAGCYRLSGHSRYGSGYPNGHWILLTAFELANGEKGAPHRFAWPIAECTARNNWQVSGLAATGTWDCVLSYGGAKAAGIDHVRINTAKNKIRLNAIGALLEAEAAQVETTAAAGAAFTLEHRTAIRNGVSKVQNRLFIMRNCSYKHGDRLSPRLRDTLLAT